MRTAVSEPREDRTRQVHFMLNGQPRAVLVEDRSALGDQPKRRRADPTNPLEVGAPMPGSVLSVLAKPGDKVSEGDPLCTVEAMKLETTVRAPQGGAIVEVLVSAKARVQSGDLMFVLANL
jgi:pyruvate carboxylase